MRERELEKRAFDQNSKSTRKKERKKTKEERREVAQISYVFALA